MIAAIRKLFPFLPVVLITCVCTGACQRGSGEIIEGNLAIIPLPVQLIQEEGYFLINENTWIQPDSFSNLSFEPLEVFNDIFYKKSGYHLASLGSSTESPDLENIILIINSQVQENPEHYKLRIRPNGITIHASDPQGLFYAFQTLRQIMRLDAVPDIVDGKRRWKIPAVDIIDEPAYAYRGMHLDVCRHFMPLDFIKKYIDLLAYYKMNRFHWHLTEDQGWRIEIKKYPRLQTIAAWRDQTLVGHYSDEPDVYDGKKHGGFYTQEQIREVVEYAASRGVMIIPEIEMPGHSLAALAAYPQLACFPDSFSVGQTWGVFEEVFCPKEETFEFLENVLAEVIDLFPGPYIHIGGDECPKTNWKVCPHCQRLMRQLGLHDEHQLQSYFIQRIEKFVNARGKKIIGWDEILEGGLAPNATVMSWRGMQGGIEAAMASHDVIMAPGTHCYFDHYQSDPNQAPLAWGGLTTLEKVYSFQPMPPSLDSTYRKFILGGQANLWTEYIETPSYAMYMAYPRALALAEALWTPVHRRHYTDFTSRLNIHRDRLDGMEVPYSKSFLEPMIETISTKAGLAISWKMGVGQDEVLYSQDTMSKRWLHASSGDTVWLKEAGSLYYKTKQSQTLSLQYNPTKSVRATISASRKPAERYSGRQGVRTLTDGMKGTKIFNGRDWCAWQGEPYSLRMNFDTLTLIDSVQLGMLLSPGAWIYLPGEILMLGTTEEGKAIPLLPAQRDEESTGRIVRTWDGNGMWYKSLVIEIRPFLAIPEGLPGAGQPSWTFLDEISIF